jgi:predicted MPP superfamily phosphohydrolase
MTVLSAPPKRRITRRRFLKTSAYVAAGAALYAGEMERHWIEFSSSEVTIAGLHPAFDGFRAVQISDIHFDEFTESFFLQGAVNRVNKLNPDIVFLTGDFVTHSPISRRIFKQAAWQCAAILNQLTCSSRFACLGNHDMLVGKEQGEKALAANGITLLNNDYRPVERGGGRFWLAGLEDALEGKPDPGAAIPPSIRHVPGEPVVLLCHAPDYADTLLAQPAGQSVALMLSGHTHGGQVRLPLIGALNLPEMGKKYVEGWFRLGNLQLNVNRGLGTVALPFRFDCPPEISVITLRSPTSRA